MNNFTLAANLFDLLEIHPNHPYQDRDAEIGNTHEDL